MSTQSRLIKKYKNRRLYDTEISQYITVDDLQRHVIAGVPFRVEDSTTGHDITNAILLQIFVEMESGTTQFLSSAMLRQLIMLAHHPLNLTVKTLMAQMMIALEKQVMVNPLITDYQKANEAWNKQAQQFMNQWQDFFKQ